MKYLRMIDGRPTESSHQVKVARGPAIRTRHGGFFESLVNPGEIVQEGQIIGNIYNAFGEIVEEIKAPINGIIRIVNFYAPKSVGEPVFDMHKIID
jgi:predicted deacylase